MNQKKISVHAYKFNSKLYRSYEFPTIIEENDDFICIDATFSKVIFLKENKNVYSKINRATLWFFFKKEYFNVIYSNKFNKIYCYINITGPFLFEEEAIKYIDFDIDYKTQDINSKKEWDLLDMDEYEQNSNEMKYPEKIKEKIIKVKEKVKNLIEIGFFNKHIEKYKDFFKISNEN